MGKAEAIPLGKYLKRVLNYPIGLVNVAYGGAPLSWWNPDENGALLDNALSLLRGTNTKLRGLLWYQGEAEGYETAAESYAQRFAAFVQHLRASIAEPVLPVILALQLASGLWRMLRALKPSCWRRSRMHRWVIWKHRSLPLVA